MKPDLPVSHASGGEADTYATLSLISHARRSLAEARSLPDIHRVIEAASVLADAAQRAAKLAEAQHAAAEIVNAASEAANDAAAIRIEAQAKAGEILRHLREDGRIAGQGRPRKRSTPANFSSAGGADPAEGTTSPATTSLDDLPLARQARIFSGRNTRRIAPQPRDAFRADYVAHDHQVVAIMSILDRYGYFTAFGSSKASARRFVCVSALREVHDWGELQAVVHLIRDAWPADEPAAQAPILTGLAAVLRLYRAVAQTELARRLARHSATEVLRLARAEHANSRDRRLWVHVAAVVVDMYNHGRTAAHRLDAPHIPSDAARQWKAPRR